MSSNSTNPVNKCDYTSEKWTDNCINEVTNFLTDYYKDEYSKPLINCAISKLLENIKSPKEYGNNSQLAIYKIGNYLKECKNIYTKDNNVGTTISIIFVLVILLTFAISLYYYFTPLNI